MKKLLSIAIALLLVFSIGACNSVPDVEQDLTYENCVVGLNGRISCWEVEEDDVSFSLLQQVNAKDEFDKDSYPDYMNDELGNYVTLNSIGDLFKAKYFDGELPHEYDDHFVLGYTQFKFIMYDKAYSPDDIFSRIVLMLNELANYEYYILSSTHVVINVYWTDIHNEAHRIIISTMSGNLLGDGIILTCDSIYDGLFEMSYNAGEDNINILDVNIYYEDNVNSKLFDVFVLDFK